MDLRCMDIHQAEKQEIMGTGIPLEKNGMMYTISLPWVWATPRIRKVIVDTIDGFQD